MDVTTKLGKKRSAIKRVSKDFSTKTVTKHRRKKKAGDISKVKHVP